MASVSEWDKILQSKFKFYEIERSIYNENRNKAYTPEMYAKAILEHLRPGDVPENLYFLYQEAVYGSDKKVKKRIFKRIYSIGNKYRYKLIFDQNI